MSAAHAERGGPGGAAPPGPMSANVTATPTRSATVGRFVLIAIGVLVAFNLAFATIDRVSGGARPGPPSSTYTTADDGLAAYGDLLGRSGRRVSRLRRPLADAQLDPSSTVIVLDATLPDDDVDALRAFVTSGGRLVAGGPTSTSWLRAIVPGMPSWQPAPAGQVAPVVPAPEVSGVGAVVSSGPGVWSAEGEALPVLVGRFGALLSVSSVGTGRVALLATAAPLRNRLLAQADNAAFGLALAGDRSRPVVFAEHYHGYGEGQGFRAIPSRARWAFGGVALGAITWMVFRSRRIGPPEHASRELPPPRRAYVEALARTLAKSKRRAEAAAPVIAAARERVTRLTGAKPDAGAESWRAAAARLGITEDEADALLRIPTSDDDVVEAGRAFAKLESLQR